MTHAYSASAPAEFDLTKSKVAIDLRTIDLDKLADLVTQEKTPAQVFFLASTLADGIYGHHIYSGDKASFDYASKGAKLGDPLCLMKAAFMLERGAGVEQKNERDIVANKKLSRDYLAQCLTAVIDLAENGNPYAETLYGVALRRSTGNPSDPRVGVARDPLRALEFLNRAANKGVADAFYCLGVLRSEGAPAPSPKVSGITIDVPQSIRYFEEAAGKGHVPSLWQLGHIYSGKHKQVPKELIDPALAFVYFEEATYQRHVPSAIEMAERLADFQKRGAARNGVPDAIAQARGRGGAHAGAYEICQRLLTDHESGMQPLTHDQWSKVKSILAPLVKTSTPRGTVGNPILVFADGSTTPEITRPAQEQAPKADAAIIAGRPQHGRPVHAKHHRR